MKYLKNLVFCLLILNSSLFLNSQSVERQSLNQLSNKEKSIIKISALAATGELTKLKPELSKGLEAGVTINEIKEILVHLYAYCGFPRSIRGLQTFMEVLDARKAAGITDVPGDSAMPVSDGRSKYERGREVLGKLTNSSQNKPLSGYSAFAPVIDTFLKEHLFADIFERSVLSYSQRELVTVSVLGAIGQVEPMLNSHLTIALNVGISQEQLKDFITVLKTTIGKKKSKAAEKVLDDILQKQNK
jgi:4-carboxymuconolactone decarboxylase